MGLCSSVEIQPQRPKKETPPPRPATPPPPPRPATPPPPPRPTTPPPPPRERTEDFSSDVVNKQIDNGSDEISVEGTQPDCPTPSPPETGSDEIIPDNNWFEDPKFERACDEYLEIDSATDELEIITTKDVSNDNKSPARILVSRRLPKLTFENVDKHAKKAGANHMASFSGLVSYLKNHGQDSAHPQTMVARAIVVWLSNQDIDKENYGEANLTSPRGLLQFLKEGRMTYATCYALLCREAGLHCTIIRGLVKAAGYEPGKTHGPSCPWTAVHVESGWQVVHPFWVCRALFGHNMGGWVKIESEGRSEFKRQRASDGVVRKTFQERYFMPKPEQFIYECYAEDTQWQLLPKDKVVPSKTDFFKMPYLLSPFFGCGLELVSEKTCILHAKNGCVQIEFRGKKANAHMLCLTYELFIKESSKTDKNFSKVEQMSRMVFNSRSDEQFLFDMRFPSAGEFKLVIYGGPYKSPCLRVCEFQIICDKPMQNFKYLPLAVNNTGWGPGPITTEAGLLMPSRPSGLVAVRNTIQGAQFRFHVTKSVIREQHDFQASLYDEIDGKRRKIDKSIEQIIDTKTCTYSITIIAKLEGEFGLQIERVAEIDRKVVCNYLVTTEVAKPEKANKKIARQNLTKELDEADKSTPQDMKKHIEIIQGAIDRCLKQQISNSDENIVAAELQLEFLKYKNGLRDCILRRNLNVTRKTLYIVSRYKYRAALEDKIREVEELERKLEAEKELESLRSADRR